jgi:two-component system cell cycle response regulator
VTLRGRLTTAFLAVVLGPVLLGSLFVALTVTAVTRDRTAERLDHATTTVRTAVGALCRQLQAAADTIAVLPAAQRRAAADQLVIRGVASGIQVSDGDGVRLFGTAVSHGGSTASSWRDCAGSPPGGAVSTGAASTAAGATAAASTGAGAIAARAEMRDATGRLLVTVSAAQALDAGFVQRLAASTGAAVTLLTGPGAGAGAALSSEPTAVAAEVAALGASLPDTAAGADPARTSDGSRFVRRLGPHEGQPLPLTLSVPGRDPTGLYALLLAAVVSVGFVAVLAAWWLARSTTRPLGELAWAVDRVADGALDTRVPVLRQDELGRLAGTFNRMTRELQSYVQALTASRDQLRGHLAILGDTLSSTHDLHRILQVILQTALSSTGARGGVVLLIDPVEGVLVARCAEGLPGRWAVADDELTALQVPLGEGVLGAVAATGEPRRGHADRDDWPMSADEPACHAFVAVPICAPVVVGDPLVPGRSEASPTATATTLGVLALYDRLGADGFDDADLFTLRTFAGQAGIAVNNVRVHEEAQRLSLTDALTGLWNYRYLKESIRREVERANRFGRMLTVIALDLDHFKEVNDTYGHAAGDTVLVEFARRIKVGLREVDLAFRQGGEEFVVLLPETDAYGGVIVAERLGAAVRDLPVPIDRRRLDPGTGAAVDRIPISVSIGIAVYPDHGAGAEELLDAADDALYAAKAAGRDTYRLAVSVDPVAGRTTPVAAAPTGAAASASGGASGGPHPPRQSRGR